MTAATSNPQILATAPRSVLITGPTSSGKTRELGRYLAWATSEGGEAWAAARRPADRAVLDEFARVARMATTAAETAGMISDAWDEMNHRYMLVESGAASGRDFTPLVVGVDDYPFTGDPAIQSQDTGAGHAETLAARCRRLTAQLMGLGAMVRVSVALTAPSPFFLTTETRAARIRHVSLPAPAGSGDDAPATAAEAARWPGRLPRRRPGKTVLPVTEAARFLFLLQVALRLQRAHLAAAAGDGAPAESGAICAYGWNPDPAGDLQPSGPCIGAVPGDGPGGRVYLLPVNAYEVASSVAGMLDASFAMTLPQAEAVLRDSGLLHGEIADGDQRHRVLRRVAGGTFRVWDLPADHLLGPGTGGTR